MVSPLVLPARADRRGGQPNPEDIIAVTGVIEAVARGLAAARNIDRGRKINTRAGAVAANAAYASGPGGDALDFGKTFAASVAVQKSAPFLRRLGSADF
jgi:hypothetical protein